MKAAVKMLLALFIGLVPANPSQSVDVAKEPMPTYAVDFTAQVVPTQRVARVVIRLGVGAGMVEWMRFQIDPLRHRSFQGDGEIVATDGEIEWRPPASGGELRYEFAIDHLRDERSYDARCASQWAIFRGGDLVPAARVRTNPVSRSRSRLYLHLPEGWSSALPYARTPNGFYTVQHSERRFDRPTGWIAVGLLGVTREEVAGTRVTLAGPAGHNFRRMDILAFLRWTLPSVRELFRRLPERLLLVGAGDPMWRGGLSGPDSVFIHTDRPLVSGDASSPVLHELVHSLMGRAPGRGGDWISEGFAELYSIELLYRSKSLSESRYREAMERLEERASRGGKLRVKSVEGDSMAKAASTLRALGAQIREASGGARGLDELLRSLIDDGGSLTTSRLREHAETLSGRDLAGFFESRVPAPAPRQPSP